jgi:diacylglycerol kinase (ATP)
MERQAARPAIVAVNPRATRVSDGRRRDALLDEVGLAVTARTGVAPEVVLTDEPRAMVGAVDQAVAVGAPLVVVVGGDGTVRDIAGLLRERPTPIAIVPAGTSNLIAGSLRIPTRADRAARLIAHGAVRSIDLGEASWGTLDGRSSERRVFVVGVGLGFDARVMATAGDRAKRRLGRYAYFLAAARELLRAAGGAVRVEADGVRMEIEAMEVLAATSGELIPGLLRPALPVAPADGLLDVFVVEGDGPIDGAWGALEAVTRRGLGPSRSGRSRRLRVREIRVTGGADQLVEVDGDLVGAGWFEAACLPGALRVLVPRRA